MPTVVQEAEREDGVTKAAGCVRIGTWNVNWAKRSFKRGPCVAEVLAAPDCDILCVTEIGNADILPEGGNVIDAGTEWGYSIPKASSGWRKVLLWSKQPWTPVFDPLQAQLPGGRLVAGVTETPIGKITVVGVCIPWRDAHVNSGRRDRVAWQDHLLWLAGFARSSFASGCPRTIVLGDFNQRIPRKSTPSGVHDEFKRAFKRLEVATEGDFLEVPAPLMEGDHFNVCMAKLREPPDKTGGALIDHIAHTGDLTLHQPQPKADGVRWVGIYPKALEGTKLSDHKGVWVDLKV